MQWFSVIGAVDYIAPRHFQAIKASGVRFTNGIRTAKTNQAAASLIDIEDRI